MAQRRMATTNQFSTVIDALQLGKKTGFLTVERGEGEAFEEGTVVFVNGQVVNAILGPYQGRDATTKLFFWRACRFSFAAMSPEQIGPWQGVPPVPAGPMEAGEVDKRSQYKLSLVNPGASEKLSRRPVQTANDLESLETILSIIDRQGFTRAHRRLFLLIDGKRSVEELAMLVRRTPDEVIALLKDLDSAGFIHL